jgi:hypothetical protein
MHADCTYYDATVYPRVNEYSMGDTHGDMLPGYMIR